MSRSALGRSDSRAMSSRVGRVVGGGGAATPRTRASVSERAQATSDHAERELEGPDTARTCASSRGVRSPALTATSASTSQRPRWRSAPRRTPSAGPTCLATGSARTRGTNSSTHIEMRWLSLIIGASCARSAPLDSPRATRASSAPKARCDWRLAATLASSGDSSGSREKQAALRAAAPPASSPDSAWRRRATACRSCASARARSPHA